MIEQHSVPSNILCCPQSASVYRTCSEYKGPHPWLLILGGNEWHSLHLLASKIKDLQHQGVLSPLLIIGVDSPKTPCCPLYASYLQQELTPWLQKHFCATDDPRHIAIAGSDDSAISALYIAIRLPRLFRAAIAIDPDLNWSPPSDPVPGWILRRFSALPSSPFLQIALYITKMNEVDQLFCSLLSAKKYLFSCEASAPINKKSFRQSSIISALTGHVSDVFVFKKIP